MYICDCWLIERNKFSVAQVSQSRVPERTAPTPARAQSDSDRKRAIVIIPSTPAHTKMRGSHLWQQQIGDLHMSKLCCCIRSVDTDTELSTVTSTVNKVSLPASEPSSHLAAARDVPDPPAPSTSIKVMSYEPVKPAAAQGNAGMSAYSVVTQAST